MRGGTGFDDTLTINPAGRMAAFLRDIGKPVHDEVLRECAQRAPADWQELAAWSEPGTQLWVPLVQQNELMGLVVLGSKKGDDFVTRGDLEILDTLAQQVAVAIRRLQLVDKLRWRMEESQALGRQILAHQERNQHRLSRELHDLLLQDVFVVRHLLEQARDTFEPERIRQALETLLELADYVRSIMFELRVPSWEDTDLPAVLEDYALDFEEIHGLVVRFLTRGNGSGGSMSDGIQTAICRIFHESLKNAWKHAQVDQVEATLDLKPDCVSLEVRDEGVGFEMPVHLGRYLDRGRLGLVSMRERAEEAGGTWRIESEPGEGTRIVVDVPLNPSQGDQEVA